MVVGVGGVEMGLRLGVGVVGEEVVVGGGGVG